MHEYDAARMFPGRGAEPELLQGRRERGADAAGGQPPDPLPGGGARRAALHPHEQERGPHARGDAVHRRRVRNPAHRKIRAHAAQRAANAERGLPRPGLPQPPRAGPRPLHAPPAARGVSDAAAEPAHRARARAAGPAGKRDAARAARLLQRAAPRFLLRPLRGALPVPGGLPLRRKPPARRARVGGGGGSDRQHDSLRPLPRAGRPAAPALPGRRRTAGGRGLRLRGLRRLHRDDQGGAGVLRLPLSPHAGGAGPALHPAAGLPLNPVRRLFKDQLLARGAPLPRHRPEELRVVEEVGAQ